VIFAALAVLLLFVVAQGRILWKEWGSLQKDITDVRRTAVIGFHNIHPNPSFAQKPADWFHDEGEFTLLWSGWKPAAGHGWFRVKRGDLARGQVSLPMGRDVIQAIDYPLVETGGGPIWTRLPQEAQVAGLELAGTMTVYPLQVLEKVVVVNDLIAEHPFIVTVNPINPKNRDVHVYDALVAGRRVTMGLSGYFFDGKPLLYDRGTESLWVAQNGGVLRAVAGGYKGTELHEIGQSSPVSWGDWQGRHPKSRLVVGGDRSKVAPTF
jgi:hypothetical protein